jgi:hypothetical protein
MDLVIELVCCCQQYAKERGGCLARQASLRLAARQFHSSLRLIESAAGVTIL